MLVNPRPLHHHIMRPLHHHTERVVQHAHCCAAAPPDEDTLTLEEYALRLAEVRAHYRATGELSQERVCMNMLATRSSDLRLNRCHIGPSTLPGAGTGLFASRDICAGELITLYPGDALLYWKHGREAPSSRICSGVIFGAHIPEEEKDTARVTGESARQYEVCASSTLSCVGDPRRDSDPAYMGHFANDGAMCDLSGQDQSAYREASKRSANADHVTLEGCQLATQATRDITSGVEIFVSYGEGYWLSHLMGPLGGMLPTRGGAIEGANAGGAQKSLQRRHRTLQPTNAPPSRKQKGGKQKGGKARHRSKGKNSGKDGSGGFDRAGNAKMCVTQTEGSPAATPLTPDVNPATGLCADGRVRIGDSPGKGLGAFAVCALSPRTPSNGSALVRGEHQIGEYRGEVYILDGLQARYGKGGMVSADDAPWQQEWSARRQARGVGVTGSYVFTISDALDPWSEVLYVDAEDPEQALWTRYINHSSERPNLLVRSSNGLSDARTTLRIVVARQIEAGDELLFDYGPGYGFGAAGLDQAIEGVS